VLVRVSAKSQEYFDLVEVWLKTNNLEAEQVLEECLQPGHLDMIIKVTQMWDNA
jgi:hypothetical protein